MKKTIILWGVSILFLMGCSSEQPIESNVIKNLNNYFEIRYSGLNADNFHQRTAEMDEYYSETLKNSDSWLVNPANLEYIYHSLHEKNIVTEILYLDIKCENTNEYNAGIIVKYNTAHIEDTYCAEYRFKVLYEDNSIMEIERISYNVTVVGDHNVIVTEGELVLS